MDEWLADEVENQVRFRDFNEWIKASKDRLAADPGHGARFAIALNHENPELDQVLEQNERFATCEKLPGPGMRRALAMDPRG
jgi:hypothetical protein